MRPRPCEWPTRTRDQRSERRDAQGNGDEGPKSSTSEDDRHHRQDERPGGPGNESGLGPGGSGGDADGNEPGDRNPEPGKGRGKGVVENGEHANSAGCGGRCEAESDGRNEDDPGAGEFRQIHAVSMRSEHRVVLTAATKPRTPGTYARSFPATGGRPRTRRSTRPRSTRSGPVRLRFRESSARRRSVR